MKTTKSEDFEDALKGQQGVIFFKGFWRRANETTAGRSGDHVDLWNGRRLTDWMSYVRIQMGFSIEGTFSDFHDSKYIGSGGAYERHQGSVVCPPYHCSCSGALRGAAARLRLTPLQGSAFADQCRKA
ncbi:type VI secretion system amidase effector protein Tae4 [Pseudomonas sp. B21-028]|uniref:type VI secretion system amidase effector protein Tae4 n=1 Tax=Pseudomonas sp. B21-028 TaxID=2895480 RepID=UPI00215FBE5C|nr:type VI secretion system amidase effector protein Tae4 [Pseudomonas sp. B21-028]UVL84909.1 type VI secretion system amidase effector protein Tae4 [Pseudomonas sp. B21-028]